MRQYKISIIIPVFNAKQHIECAMQSLIKQSIGFGELQVILVDDCSTDGTSNIVKAFAEKYENVHAYKTERNSGAAGAPRNIGLEHVQAEYVMFLDPDDYLGLNSCKFLYEQAEKEKADIVGGTYRFVSGESDEDVFCETEEIVRSEYHLPDQLMDALKYRFPLWTKIYRRKLIQDNHILFPKEGYGQDTVFLVECLTKANRYVLYGIPVYNYRVHEQSVTQKQKRTFFARNENCMRLCRQILKEYPDGARWLQGNLSNYFIEKCVEFESIDRDELITLFQEKRDLFIHEWEVPDTATISVLVREEKYELAAECVCRMRALKEEDKHMQEIKARLAAIEEKLSVLDIMENKKQQNLQLEQQNRQLEQQNLQLEQQNLQLEQQNRQLEQQNENAAAEMRRLQHELRVAQNELNQIHQSDFYKLSLRYYKIRDRLFPADSVQRRLLKKTFRGIKRILGKGDMQNLAYENQLELLQSYGKYKRMDIVTTKHTMFVAQLLKNQLDRLSIECQIHVGEPEVYADIPYIIVCPQFVRYFPKVYFVFQMEQTVSSRWFTPQYYMILQNSCGILDYSLENVEYFHLPEQHDVRSRVYYQPIDYLPGFAKNTSKQKKEYDVLFYGDAKNERRQRILNEISKKYKVKVCSEVFGEDVYEEIRKCKVLVNIHYYENALLETTRLYETLSLNTCMIVSEDSKDITELNRLKDFVDFVAIDDVDEMIKRIGYWVEHDAQRQQRIAENQKMLEERANAFDYYFNRFLLAYDRIDFNQFYQIAGNFFKIHTNRICLTLPESTKRRRSFDQDNKYGFECIPGLRHQKGWVGCGMSYKLIFMKAKEAKLDNIMICEDDVIFPDNFESRLRGITDYLHRKNAWSVFSGLLADADKLHILKSEKMDDGYMAQVDHMISMVFNVYNKSVFDNVIQWNEQDRDVHKNAIDRYLEREKLEIYVQLPFLVGHKEELDSTIWGFSNIQYLEMIKKSEKKLLDMAKESIDK